MQSLSRLDLVKCMFTGNIVSAIGFGITTIQSWKYSIEFPHDSLFIKCTVATLWLIQGLQTSCSSRAMYWYLVTEFGNFRALHWSPWETRMPLAAGAVGAFILQTYLVWRIYQLNKSRILMCINAVLVTFSFAVGSVFVATTAIHTSNAWSSTPDWALVSWAVSGALADSTLTVCMAVLLLRRRGGSHRTDQMVTRMVICLINTGIFTCLASILLAAFVLSGEAQGIIAVSQCYGSFYIIAMLSLLHSRSCLQEAPTTSKVQLGPLGAKGAVVVAIARETRRASFHNGDAEIAVWSRIESRYPHIESRTYGNLVSELDKRGDTGQTGGGTIVELTETP